MNSWGLFTAIGGVTSVLWLLHHRRDFGLTQNEFWAGTWIIVFGGAVGAKLLFLLLGWEHYVRGDLRFWLDFDIGFVFFGGLIGAVISSLIFARMKKLSFMKGADYFAVAVPMGHAIGRIGCFLTGCCGGRPPHPVQLYESFGLILIAGVCRGVLTRVESGKNIPGTAFYSYLFLYSFLRFILDPFRADGRPERLFGLSYQQLIALIIIVIVCLYVNQRGLTHKK